MIQRGALAAVLGILLAASASVAEAAKILPYVTVTLEGFERASIHKRAVSLMHTELVFDGEGNFVSSDTDVHYFDNLQLRPLTTDGGAKASFSLKSSSGYVGWAQFFESGVDIMAYDLKRNAVVNVSNTPVNEDPFFDLEDDRFVWKLLDSDASEYDVVFSDGKKKKATVNESSNDDYSLVFGDPDTSGSKAAFSAAGTDPEDGTSDSEVFFYDGKRLRQVTDDGPVGDTGTGYEDSIPLVSGGQVVFRTRHPEQDVEPCRIRIYQGPKKPIRTLVSGGDTITGGHVLVDDFCFPLDFADGLLVWNGSIVGVGPVLLLTDVRTGETVSLDDLTGGSVFIAATEDGYVGMFSEDDEGNALVMVYRAKSKQLATAATHPPGFTHSGLLSISGPNVAYNYFEGDEAKVAVHYRSDQYKKELKASQ